MASVSEDPRLQALVVDDEPMIRQLTVAALEKEGFRCDVAINGDSAIKCAVEHRYDVVVTDLKMPQHNGHTLAVNLLEQPARPLIVVFTGMLEPRLAKDLMARGVDDIVFKPVNFTAFAAKVRSLVNRRQRTEAAAAEPMPTAADEAGS